MVYRSKCHHEFISDHDWESSIAWLESSCIYQLTIAWRQLVDDILVVESELLLCLSCSIVKIMPKIQLACQFLLLIVSVPYASFIIDLLLLSIQCLLAITNAY